MKVPNLCPPIKAPLGLALCNPEPKFSFTVQWSRAAGLMCLGPQTPRAFHILELQFFRVKGSGTGLDAAVALVPDPHATGSGADDLVGCAGIMRLGHGSLGVYSSRVQYFLTGRTLLSEDPQTLNRVCELFRLVQTLQVKEPEENSLPRRYWIWHQAECSISWEGGDVKALNSSRVTQDDARLQKVCRAPCQVSRRSKAFLGKLEVGGRMA